VLVLEEYASEEYPNLVFELYDTKTFRIFRKIRGIVALEVEFFAQNKPELWQKLEVEINQFRNAYVCQA
jgi:hypothetical protein